MRVQFKQSLLTEIRKNNNIILVTADLGYKMWDDIAKEFPNNFINVGASEQLMIGACVGLTYASKIPIAYSITPFLLYRGFEFIRNYISHEGANVKLVGSGMLSDYSVDGFSHHDFTAVKAMEMLGIECFTPSSVEDLNNILPRWISSPKPSFLGLRR
jgi:transketolase